MFSSLPNTVMFSIFKEWLFLEEVSKLDTALCNQNARNEFLKLLRMTDFSFTSAHVNNDTISFLFWAWTREIIVKKLSVDENVAQLLRKTENCEKLHLVEILQINYEKHFKSYQEMLQKCIRLREFAVVNSKVPGLTRADHQYLKLFAVLSTSLQTLSLINVQDLTIKNLEKLTSTHDHLQEMTLDNCNLSITGFTALTSKLCGLKKLKLLNNANIGFVECCRSLADNCPELEDLYFLTVEEKIPKNALCGDEGGLKIMNNLTKLTTNVAQVIQSLWNFPDLIQFYIVFNDKFPDPDYDSWVIDVSHTNRNIKLTRISIHGISLSRHGNRYHLPLSMSHISLFTSLTELYLNGVSHIHYVQFRDMLHCCVALRSVSVIDCLAEEINQDYNYQNKDTGKIDILHKLVLNCDWFMISHLIALFVDTYRKIGTVYVSHNKLRAIGRELLESVDAEIIDA